MRKYHGHLRFINLVFISFISLTTFSQKNNVKIEELKQQLLKDPKVKSVEFSEVRQTPSFIDLDIQKSTFKKDQARILLDNYLKVKNGVDALVGDKETQFADNIEVVEFQQYYRGIKVEFGKYKALVKDGKVRFFNGAYFDIPATFSVNPSLAKVNALNMAKRRVGAKKYATDLLDDQINETKDLRTKQALIKEKEEVSPKGELVIVRDFNKEGVAELKLAYKFDIYATEPLSRSWIYVDAAAGNILLVDPIIKHAGTNPPASTSSNVPTRYAGNRKIMVQQVSGNDPNSGLPLVSSHPTSEYYVPGSPTYILKDDTRGGGIETYDLNGVGGVPLSVSGFYTQAKSFTDVDNIWTQFEHKRAIVEGGAAEAENDDIAFDAHWGAEMVYDYWKTKHARLSYDNKNAKIKSYIHYGPAYDNAFWNGTAMTYGDGSGTDAGGFKALTSLDVCGHEIGHGVCEFTANLVYAKESGAMNEAFSDIWAACIEHFAITTIDPSLASIYRPFYIGEQISASPDQPLRRMDNPKAAGDPDTYGGTNWKNPDCSPSLTNDQCGVHTNSGILNKWFYLITVGSGSGSGPNASYARPDSDDGINDAVNNNPVEGTHGANSYSVTGLGFTTSEKITYLTELLLTSTATYSEARQVSIAVATELTGNSCSAMVETVTNAWYAVGIGAKFVKPCTVTYGFINKGGLSVNEGNGAKGCAAQKVYNIPVLMPAASTASITISGTASKTNDYVISPASLSNTTTGIVKQNIAVTVYNDAAVEANESIILNLAITKTGTNPVNKTLTVTILDDDVTPVIGTGDKTLVTQTFTQADGFAELPGWTEVKEIPEGANGDPAAFGKNQWGIFNGKLSITGKEGTTGVQLPAGNYNNLSESKTYVKMPQIDARGLSLLKIKFDYEVQGEVDFTGANPTAPDPENLPVFDYMAVMYSLDGVNFVELNTGDFKQFAASTPTKGTFTGKLPVSLANQKFYLAFRWYNDGNAGGPVSVSVDNLTITGAPRKLENHLNYTGNEKLAPNSEAYFYSSQEDELIAFVKNNSGSNFGCTYATIEKTGSSAFDLYRNGDSIQKVSSKVVRLQPANNLTGAANIYLYFTEAQLKAVETATKKSRTALTVYQVDAGNNTGATSANTKRYAATYTSIPGVGGYYKIAITNKLMASYTIGSAVKAPSTLRVATADHVKVNDWKFEKAYPNPSNGTFTFNITAPQAKKVTMEVVNVAGQLVHLQNQKLLQGVNQVKIGLNKPVIGNYILFVKDEFGKPLNSQQFIIK